MSVPAAISFFLALALNGHTVVGTIACLILTVVFIFAE